MFMKMMTNNIKWNFKNKDVLVVGSSRGIGKGIFDEFKSNGAKVLGIDSSICDISCESQIDTYFKAINNIDILINVAAINHTKKIEDINIEEWDDVLDVNLRSFFYIIKKTLKVMPRGSKIVNVSSIAGRHRSLVSGVHYVSSKAGIIGLTRQLAYELGSKNINVNVVCPSQTMTDMLKKSMSEKELEHLSKKIPLKRIASVREQVYPVMFLCSEEASYITGAVLDVNGGQI